jgi:hypothetical protein
MLMDWQD